MKMQHLEYKLTMEICRCLLLVLSFCAVVTKSRKSDYKRIIFSEYVNNTFESNFQEALQRLGEDSEEVQLYNEYLKDYINATVNRIQPSKHVGDKQNITIDGNRKKWVVLETLSKRRPLLFQIDDFLFDDECEYIKQAAVDLGLGVSTTFGPNGETMYDDINEMNFEYVDLDNNTLINSTELAGFFASYYDNRLGNLLIREIMRETMMDFNLDGFVEPWEWNIKNLTRLVMMLNETLSMNPASKVRHSEQQWLSQTDSDSTVLRSIQDRLQKVTGLPLPMIRNSEYLQVVKYQPGGHYDCHLDSSDEYRSDNFKPCCHVTPEDTGNNDCGVCRFMTVLYYLDGTESGGHTAFPVAGVDPYENDIDVDSTGRDHDWCTLSVHCQKSKIRVTPKKGRAVLWYNHFINPDTEWIGSLDRNSLHGGCSVNKGTKWIANNWINVGHHKKHDILKWAATEIDLKRMKKEEEEEMEKRKLEKDFENNEDVELQTRPSPLPDSILPDDIPETTPDNIKNNEL